MNLVEKFRGWNETEISRLQQLFIQRYGPGILPSQVDDLLEEPIRFPDRPAVPKEALNPPGPRFL
jgi:hypothetical protein